MYFTTLSSVLVFLSFLSTSTATEQPHDKHAIRVPLERKSFITHLPSGRGLARRSNQNIFEAHMAHVAAKYCDTLAAYQTNTGSPHPLARAISVIGAGAFGDGLCGVGTSLQTHRFIKRNANDISLTEVNSNMWMGTISVGTPPQNFTVDFDTGSADLIIPDQACDSSCDGHTRYNSSASSTSVDLDRTFTMAYTGGSGVNGTQYTDNVYMGGYEAANQTFGAATTYSSGMSVSSFPPDGLLGMGFSSISSLPASPVFQTMVSNDVVPEAVFGLALSSESGESELTIGGTNTGMYQESTVEYLNLSLPAYWQVPFAGLTRPGLNNTPEVVVVDKTSYAQSIVDSGTLLIITSDSSAKAFYANVTGATEMSGGLWSVPCDVVGSLAPTLTFGSRNFTVSSSTFNLGPVSDGSTDCISGLAGGGSVYWIIGDVFLQNVYTIFDVGNTRIGFADLA